MAQIFDDDGTDGILLADTSNIQISSPEMSMYIINTYISPLTLFTCGGEEILSQEGTTEGDPPAMPWYVINTSILIQSLRARIPEVKQVTVWLADDSAGGGPTELSYNWYKLFS